MHVWFARPCVDEPASPLGGGAPIGFGKRLCGNYKLYINRSLRRRKLLAYEEEWADERGFPCRALRTSCGVDGRHSEVLALTPNAAGKAGEEINNESSGACGIHGCLGRKLLPLIAPATTLA